jgi:hypothetical protein
MKPTPFDVQADLPPINLDKRHFFLRIFGTQDSMTEKLVWLPTWHQACLLCSESMERGRAFVAW